MQYPQKPQARAKRWGWGRIVVPVLVLALALFIAACGDDNNSSDNSSDSSSSSSSAKLDFPSKFPNFDASYLTKEPGDNWLTNGGTLSNDRYSPLDEINTSNVAGLKAVYKVDLASGTEAKYSHEEQPIIYNGVAYIATGEDDVFAIDVTTGETKWKYEGNLDPDISTVCCGWLSRGVGIGDGKVYIGKLDGHMVALDQDSGKVVWDHKVADWKQDNGGITAAPLYYDGLIYTGITGGEFGVRGRMTALDAKTGDEKWRFYTPAGPDDKVGGSTWTGDSYLTGGAPIWQTPTIDPKLGMIYFSTGNANPDVDGSARGGDNLYGSSFVALDWKTGKYKWHYQTVHHDIWDYDMPSPTVLFDTKVDGKTVHAIAQSAKTGWVYVINRATGKPILPITETPVPQDPQQKTSKTQPIPQYDSLADHHVSDAEYAAIKAQVAANPEGKGLKVLKPADETPAANVFSPPHLDGKSVTVITNGPTGGTNWMPSSYNPKTKLLYACGLDGVAGMYPSGVEERKPGEVRLGSILTALPFGATPGYLKAFDPATGETKWTAPYKDSCYSGSTTTGGNLVFSGHNDGTFHAYNAKTGEDLWSFQTGAGANSTATIFNHKGHEYVMVVAGGNSLAASPHGDNLWVFSLDGTGNELPGIEANSAKGGVDHFNPNGEVDNDSNSSTDTSASDTTSSTGETADTGGTKDAGDVAAGKSTFQNNCQVCHGAKGTGGNGGPDISMQKNLQHVQDQVTNGGGGMPAFKGQLTDADILNVATYVTTVIAGASGK